MPTFNDILLEALHDRSRALDMYPSEEHLAQMVPQAYEKFAKYYTSMLTKHDFDDFVLDEEEGTIDVTAKKVKKGKKSKKKKKGKKS